jgi:hypothetical protein
VAQRRLPVRKIREVLRLKAATLTLLPEPDFESRGYRQYVRICANLCAFTSVDVHWRLLVVVLTRCAAPVQHVLCEDRSWADPPASPAGARVRLPRRAPFTRRRQARRIAQTTHATQLPAR